MNDRGERKGGVRTLRPEPAGDTQRASRRVSTWGRVGEGGETQEEEARRRMGVGAPLHMRS